MSAAKIISLPFLLLFGLLISNLVGLSSAQASSLQVEGLQISGLGNYRGQFLTVYYGSGKRPSLSVGTADFDMHHVLEKKTLSIESDTLSLEPTQLSLVGLWPLKANLIGLVIHRQPKVTYMNANGTLPKNEEPNNSQQASRLDSITFDELKALSSAQMINGVRPRTVKYNLR